MNQKGSVALLLLLIILLSGTSFLVGFYLARQTKITRLSTINPPKIINSLKKVENKVIEDKCSYYGYLFNKDDYLPRYTVKKGDTLGSLAKIYLGNIDRYKEIVELNKDRYQNLYVDSFLEIGWILYLPSTFAFPTQSIIGYVGEVIDNTGDFIVIDYYSKKVKDTHPVMRLKKEPKTKYFEKYNYNIGDCVGVLVDSAFFGEIYKLVAIAPEQSYRKYFTQTEGARE